MRQHPERRAPSGELAEAERWLGSLEVFGMRFGLHRMRRLLTGRRWTADVVHVVGTNGKSSTTRMIESLLRHHGRRTGAYLSPHLVSFTERILSEGREIGPGRLAAVLGRARSDVERLERTLSEGEHVTQFEALTYAALCALDDDDVDVCVLEAGLGGRYDATNVLAAEVVVLTNVGLEHTRWLGPTIADIAREKLAVVGPETSTLVVGHELHPDAEAEARRVCAQHDARLVRAPAAPAGADELLARGAFQRRNFAVACTAAGAYLGVLDEAAKRTAATSTAVPGRFEVVGCEPEVVLDGAHNPSGIAALAETLRAHAGGRRLAAVVSVLDDKDAAGMLRTLLPLCDVAVFTSNANPRALSPATLGSLASQVAPGLRSELETDPRRALDRARELAGPDGLVVATGSIYLVGDLSGPR